MVGGDFGGRWRTMSSLMIEGYIWTKEFNVPPNLKALNEKNGGGQPYQPDRAKDVHVEPVHVVRHVQVRAL